MLQEELEEIQGYPVLVLYVLCVMAPVEEEQEDLLFFNHHLLIFSPIFLFKFQEDGEEVYQLIPAEEEEEEELFVPQILFR
jgi:hypothetical protein